MDRRYFPSWILLARRNVDRPHDVTRLRLFWTDDGRRRGRRSDAVGGKGDCRNRRHRAHIVAHQFIDTRLDIGIALLLHVADIAVPLLRSEEHTSELQSLMRISYAVFCLKKKNKNHYN